MRSKTFVILLLVGSFLMFQLVLSAESTSTSSFEAKGCITPDGKNVRLDSCSQDGEYYCNKTSTLEARLIHTTEEASPDLACCPSGYKQNPSTGICEQRVTDCSAYSDKISCEADDCFWIDQTGGDSEPFCADRPQDFSCSVYKDQSACEVDFLNLGKIGFGTEICGEAYLNGLPIGSGSEYFVTPTSSCRCEWTPAGDCRLYYAVKQDIYEEGQSPDAFECRKKFDSGFCIDGVQSVSWTAERVDSFGSVNPPQSLLENSLCVDGSGERSCGETIVRLPGFSKLSLVLSFLLIGLFYFLKKDDFN